ncbi:MAG: translation initiation factor IF-3 [Candidatus Liptonbacteria bacterium]
MIPAILKPRINNQITAPQLRVINSEGKNLGVITREEALGLARPEEGLDLIEISSTATPPVARIMSFDKYRYEREKAEKKERQLQKAAGVKRIQISVRAAKHDLQTKLHQLEKFLDEGHQVEVYVRLRGREKYNQNWANQKLQEFLKMITVDYKTMGAPRFAQGLSIQITKK